MKTPNNIDKPVPGRGNNEATKEILLAVDKEKLEFDAMNDILDTLMEEFKKEAKPDTSFLDWLKSKDKDYFQRLKYDAGGPVKPKVYCEDPVCLTSRLKQSLQIFPDLIFSRQKSFLAIFLCFSQ